uniref:Uncharacterized protein n=1 Tax=Rhizophora mucronata TaxID=61149 RepID=A0A2P2KYC3_RHIMU
MHLDLPRPHNMEAFYVGIHLLCDTENLVGQCMNLIFYKRNFTFLFH